MRERGAGKLSRGKTCDTGMRRVGVSWTRRSTRLVAVNGRRLLIPRRTEKCFQLFVFLKD